MTVELSPALVEDVLGRALSPADTPLEPEESRLVLRLRNECWPAFNERYPDRARLAAEWMAGATKEALAKRFGIALRTAQDWVLCWLRFAAGWTTRQAKKNDLDILESICFMTHRRQERGGSGGDTAPKLRGTMCIGCQARAG
jgi:hypothetical protein